MSLLTWISKSVILQALTGRWRFQNLPKWKRRAAWLAAGLAGWLLRWRGWLALAWGSPSLPCWDILEPSAPVQGLQNYWFYTSGWRLHVFYICLILFLYFVGVFKIEILEPQATGCQPASQVASQPARRFHFRKNLWFYICCWQLHVFNTFL